MGTLWAALQASMMGRMDSGDVKRRVSTTMAQRLACRAFFSVVYAPSPAGAGVSTACAATEAPEAAARAKVDNPATFRK